MSKLQDALAAARETRELRIGQGMISAVPEIFLEQFPGRKAVVIADSTTYRIAGETVKNLLNDAGIEQFPPFIFTDPNLYAAYKYIDQLVKFLTENDATPIAVGSGTINDLTKLAAHLTNRQYMCVATAASMDGYTAFGASITKNGAKLTFSCPAPQACLADIDIICNAPSLMTASGYGDLFAKVTAGADWILADSLQVEPLDPVAWDIVQGGLHDALSDPEGISSADPRAITNLVEGLMLAGFAMQSAQSSRPASGAEHQFSHLWNMEKHLNKGLPIAHGFQVSIATIAITMLYEFFLATPVEELVVEKSLEKWPKEDEMKEIVSAMFMDEEFSEIAIEETMTKYSDSGIVANQLHLLKSNWAELKEKLSQQIVPHEELIRRLAMVGAPVDPSAIGITREHLKATFIRAQFIRRRFTVLDVSVRAGYLNQWLERLFGKGGIWEI